MRGLVLTREVEQKQDDPENLQKIRALLRDILLTPVV